MSSLFPAEPAKVRASDADRERITDILTKNAGDGRLTPDELASRAAVALKAQTVGELRALVADLPEGNVKPGLPPVVEGFVRQGRSLLQMSVWAIALAVTLSFVVPVAVVLNVFVSRVAGWGLIAGTVALFVLVLARMRG